MIYKFQRRDGVFSTTCDAGSFALTLTRNSSLVHLDAIRYGLDDIKLKQLPQGVNIEIIHDEPTGGTIRFLYAGSAISIEEVVEKWEQKRREEIRLLYSLLAKTGENLDGK